MPVVAEEMGVVRPNLMIASSEVRHARPLKCTAAASTSKLFIRSLFSLHHLFLLQVMLLDWGYLLHAVQM